ncbi:uncharacterized protein LOC9630220 [Selaginella moellendorffii]|uniref:uncharacterized protein LOC9630220 n=1 Tax=Selaginella moellendorffii TaxID=88036 RepID=UPI000D1CA0E4|nr:uncharacterized protein LOC9630220 [Selaginella moellendorffii]|eukprot:XP_024522096.1 uncharacterized protein LOC9630220 [Selaginella moellendorffii]
MMDPQAFVKVSIAALGLRIPIASKAARVGVHSSSIPCYCEISLPGFPVQTAPVPLITATAPEPDSRNVAAVFYLDHSSLRKLLAVHCCLGSRKAAPCLKVVVFTGRQGSCCGVREGSFLGKFSIPVDSEWLSGNPLQLYDSWASIGKKGGSPGAEFHLNARIEADPRFVFQFDGDTASGPQIIQIQGSLRQPIFSCKFSRDRSCRARLGFTDTPAKSWSTSLTGDRERERKERKGWLVMIHDLSGSPVAAASIVTPFVPSSGSDYVSRSNPGAWLILRPDSTGVDSWEPWGRLEAWREKGGKGGLGLRFQLVAEGGGITSVGSGILVSETVISTQSGGEFSIDTVRLRVEAASSSSSTESPHSSGDGFLGLGFQVAGGFVMSCPVHGERNKTNKGRCIQMAVRHVTCVEDAAVFMALAAAADLSMDACQPFSRKLRRELCYQQGE